MSANRTLLPVPSANPPIRARLEWHADQRGSWGPVEGNATVVCEQLATAASLDLGLTGDLLLSTLLVKRGRRNLDGFKQVVVFEHPPNGWVTLIAGPASDGPPLSGPAGDEFVDGLVTARWTTAREPDGQEVLVPPGELLLEERVVSALPGHLGVQADQVGLHFQLARLDGKSAALLKVVLRLPDGDLVVTVDEGE